MAAKIGAQFGVRWTAPDYLREVHKALGADLTQLMEAGHQFSAIKMPRELLS
jgi:hypothetical protein